jgi:hypothetical protein
VWRAGTIPIGGQSDHFPLMGDLEDPEFGFSDRSHDRGLA